MPRLRDKVPLPAFLRPHDAPKVHASMIRLPAVLPVLAQGLAPCLVLCLVLCLAACAPPQGHDVTQFIAPTKIETQSGPPPEDGDGQCWGFIAGETRTELEEQLIEVEPPKQAADSDEITPPIFRKASVPVEITDPGRSFLRICDTDLPPLVAALQRALDARGIYQGAITGEMDAATRDAVRRYQADQGVDSAILSLAAARQLGLVAVEIERPEFEPELEPEPELGPEVDAPSTPSDVTVPIPRPDR